MSPPRSPRFHTYFFGLFLSLLLVACGDEGTAPQWQSLSDQRVAVAQELVVTLNATDADGDDLFYSFSSDVPDINSRATITRLPIGAGEFRWTPESRDVGEWFFDFEVSDGSKTETVTIRIEVVAAGGNSAPRFIRPLGSGTTLDLELRNCLRLDIEIDDPDTPSVDIGQGEPIIVGATLNQTTATSAVWEWCPTPAQYENEDRFSLVLTADDNDNPLVSHPFLVVVRPPVKKDCPGDAPVIVHQATDRTTLGGIEIVATVTDDQGLRANPLIHFSADSPGAPPDLGAMQQKVMSAGANPNEFRAILPNPSLVLGEGGSAPLYYLIIADDDDDPQGNCDHTTQLPEAEAFEITVTNPGGTGGTELCEPCTADAQCGGSTDFCGVVGTGSETFCLQSCEGGCPTNFVCSEEPIESVGGQTAPQCVPISNDCSNPGGEICVDDVLEDNDTPEQARANAALAEDTHSLISCPSSVEGQDDEDWFLLEIAEEGQLSLTLSGDDQISDLDISVSDNNENVLDASVSFTSQEEIDICVAPGSYLVRVHAFGEGRNPYDLSYLHSPRSCDPNSCQPDAAEDDDSPAQATSTAGANPFTAADRSVCVGDEDWFEVVFQNGEIAQVDLTLGDTPSGDLDLHLYDEAGVDLTPCSPDDTLSCDTQNGQGSGSTEQALYEAPVSGCPCTFYVVVQGFDPTSDENDYSISIEVQ